MSMSKKQSGSSNLQPQHRPQNSHEYFADRDLGKRFVRVLRDNALVVHDYPSNQLKDTTPDTDWLKIGRLHTCLHSTNRLKTGDLCKKKRQRQRRANNYYR